MNKNIADIWIVAGPPGSGKTTVANVLQNQLDLKPAFLDKDTIYNVIEEAMLRGAGRPQDERESTWYDEHIKKYVYEGLINTTREIRSKGCPVILVAPFTQQIHNKKAWSELVYRLGDGKIKLIWLRTDSETLRRRLASRHESRDGLKIAKYDEFALSMQLDSIPPVDHCTVDNRMSARKSIEEQVAEILLK